MEDKKNTQKEAADILVTIIKFVLITAFIAIAGVVITYIYKFNGPLSNEQADWGTFGDYMGGTLNPILGFLTIFILLITVILQTKELGLTREELELSRKEMEKSSTALQEQSESIKQQNFENTFFQMLKLQNEILENIEVPQDSILLKGRKAFEELIVTLDHYYLTTCLNAKTETDEELLEKAVTMLYNKYEKRIGHYFRNLYHIIKMIDAYDINYLANNDIKFKYSTIVRAQSSTFETLLLFYNSFQESGKGMKKYVERYALLKHINKNKLLSAKYINQGQKLTPHENFYTNKAYGKA